MKKQININILFLLLGIMAFTFACDKDENGPSETERVSALLTSGNTWNMQSVTVDGTDKTSIYTGLQLSFTATTYTTVKGEPVWPASGTWQFNDEEAKTVKRSDDVIITINEVSANKLVLALPWTKTTLGAGRINSISGQHVFTFTK